MKLFIKTFGCQANKSDSEIIAGLLSDSGHKIVQSEKNADIIIINSCSVKNKTQSKILDYISKSGKKIIVGGCLPKTIDLRKKFSSLLAILDTNSISKIADIVKNPHDEFSSEKYAKLSLPAVRKDKKTAILQISEGCLNECSFCSTKLSRGNLKSYRIGDIKRAFEKAVSEGCSTIYLTSQDNGCYGFDINTSLPELLAELTKVNGNYKIRIGMMNPWHVKKIISPMIKAYKPDKVQKFIHIPIQSGSNKVLKDMGRLGTSQDFITISRKFRKAFPRAKFPDSTIATDIIVGYPTETEQEFKKTIDLIKKIKPEVLNISAFSSRPKTKASKIKQLSSETIKQRTKALNALYLSYRKELDKILKVNMSLKQWSI